jgi:hypothetical protein
MRQKLHQQRRLSKDGSAPARRPLERRRDWVFAILGVVALGVGGGYLFEGRPISWPLVVALGTFIVAVAQRYRHHG